MTQVFFIYLWLCTMNFHNIKKDLNNCFPSDNELKIIFSSHFLLVSTITITILQTSNINVHDFAQKIIQNLNINKITVAVTIKQKFFDSNDDYKKVFYNTCKTENLTESYYNSLTEFVKTRKLTSDSREGYVLIAWSLDVLKSFLYEVISESRATYFFIFISSHDRKTIEFLFKQLWNSYNILNIVVVVYRKIYIYRPFVKNKNSWGRLDEYNFNTIFNNPILLTNSLSNFNQYSLPISIFERDPTAIKELPKLVKNNPVYKNLIFSTGFYGSDGSMLNTMATMLNFSVTIVENFDKLRFGRVWSNGSVCGTLGDVVKRHVVLSSNGRILADYNTREIEYTISYNGDSICIAVPKSLKVPNWRVLLECFDKTSSILIFVVFVICLLFWYFVSPKIFFGKILYDVFSFLMGIPIRIVPSLNQFFFLSSCMVFNVIILQLLQGWLFTAFTTTTFYPDIVTLQGVYESKLSIATNMWFLIKDDSDIIQQLKNRTVEKTPNILDVAAHHRNVCVLDKKLDLELYSKSKYVGNDGLSLLHVVDECLTSVLIVNIVPKGSPFLLIFNNVISQLFESGFTKRWYNDIVSSRITEKMVSLERKPDKITFSVKDLQAAFYIITVGYVLSLFVFFVEMFSRFL